MIPTEGKIHFWDIEIILLILSKLCSPLCVWPTTDFPVKTINNETNWYYKGGNTYKYILDGIPGILNKNTESLVSDKF